MTPLTFAGDSSQMRSPVTPHDLASFIKVVRLSQLVSEESLNSLANQFEAERKFFVEQSEEMLAFSDQLVNQGAVTSWQRDKLLSGRHRGFFHEGYVIQEMLYKDSFHTYYKAMNLKDGTTVKLKATFSDNGKIVLDYVTQ